MDFRDELIQDFFSAISQSFNLDETITNVISRQNKSLEFIKKFLEYEKAHKLLPSAFLNENETMVNNITENIMEKLPKNKEMINSYLNCYVYFKKYEIAERLIQKIWDERPDFIIVVIVFQLSGDENDVVDELIKFWYRISSVNENVKRMKYEIDYLHYDNQPFGWISSSPNKKDLIIYSISHTSSMEVFQQGYELIERIGAKHTENVRELMPPRTRIIYPETRTEPDEERMFNVKELFEKNMCIFKPKYSHGKKMPENYELKMRWLLNEKGVQFNWYYDEENRAKLYPSILKICKKVLN